MRTLLAAADGVTPRHSEAARQLHDAARAAAEDVLTASEQETQDPQYRDALIMMALRAAAAVDGFSPEVRLRSYAFKSLRQTSFRSYDYSSTITRPWSHAGNPRIMTILSNTQYCRRQEFCLHPLVAACVDRAALFAALRNLTAGEAVALLRYLLVWVRCVAGLVCVQTRQAICMFDHIAMVSYCLPCHIMRCTL